MHAYQDNILDHYHNPRYAGTLTHPTHVADGHNAQCGDTMHIVLRVDNGVIADAAFSGEGCAISQATASMLLEHVVQKPVDVLANMDASAMLELLGAELSPARLKCALLALETAHKALKNEV